MLRGPAGKTYPVSLAADRLVQGIHRRKRRVFVPASLLVQHVLRGAISRLLDSEFRRMAIEVDRLTEDKVNERGRFAAALSESVLTARDGRSGMG
jgi:hypothetical protein